MNTLPLSVDIGAGRFTSRDPEARPGIPQALPHAGFRGGRHGQQYVDYRPADLVVLGEGAGRRDMFSRSREPEAGFAHRKDSIRLHRLFCESLMN